MRFEGLVGFAAGNIALTISSAVVSISIMPVNGRQSFNFSIFLSENTEFSGIIQNALRLQHGDFSTFKSRLDRQYHWRVSRAMACLSLRHLPWAAFHAGFHPLDVDPLRLRIDLP